MWNKCGLTKQNGIDVMLCLRDQADYLIISGISEPEMHGWILTIGPLL